MPGTKASILRFDVHRSGMSPLNYRLLHVQYPRRNTSSLTMTNQTIAQQALSRVPTTVRKTGSKDAGDQYSQKISACYEMFSTGSCIRVQGLDRRPKHHQLGLLSDQANIPKDGLVMYQNEPMKCTVVSVDRTFTFSLYFSATFAITSWHILWKGLNGAIGLKFKKKIDVQKLATQPASTSSREA